MSRLNGLSNAIDHVIHQVLINDDLKVPVVTAKAPLKPPVSQPSKHCHSSFEMSALMSESETNLMIRSKDIPRCEEETKEMLNEKSQHSLIESSNDSSSDVSSMSENECKHRERKVTLETALAHLSDSSQMSRYLKTTDNRNHMSNKEMDLNTAIKITLLSLKMRSHRERIRQHDYDSDTDSTESSSTINSTTLDNLSGTMIRDSVPLSAELESEEEDTKRDTPKNNKFRNRFKQLEQQSSKPDHPNESHLSNMEREECKQSLIESMKQKRYHRRDSHKDGGDVDELISFSCIHNKLAHQHLRPFVWQVKIQDRMQSEDLTSQLQYQIYHHRDRYQKLLRQTRESKMLDLNQVCCNMISESDQNRIEKEWHISTKVDQDHSHRISGVRIADKWGMVDLSDKSNPTLSWSKIHTVPLVRIERFCSRIAHCKLVIDFRNHPRGKVYLCGSLVRPYEQPLLDLRDVVRDTNRRRMEERTELSSKISDRNGHPVSCYSLIPFRIPVRGMSHLKRDYYNHWQRYLMEYHEYQYWQQIRIKSEQPSIDDINEHSVPEIPPTLDELFENELKQLDEGMEPLKAGDYVSYLLYYEMVDEQCGCGITEIRAMNLRREWKTDEYDSDIVFERLQNEILFRFTDPSTQVTRSMPDLFPPDGSMTVPIPSPESTPGLDRSDDNSTMQHDHPHQKPMVLSSDVVTVPLDHQSFTFGVQYQNPEKLLCVIWQYRELSDESFNVKTRMNICIDDMIQCTPKWNKYSSKLRFQWNNFQMKDCLSIEWAYQKIRDSLNQHKVYPWRLKLDKQEREVFIDFEQSMIFTRSLSKGNPINCSRVRRIHKFVSQIERVDYDSQIIWLSRDLCQYQSGMWDLLRSDDRDTHQGVYEHIPLSFGTWMEQLGTKDGWKNLQSISQVNIGDWIEYELIHTYNPQYTVKVQQNMINQNDMNHNNVDSWDQQSSLSSSSSSEMIVEYHFQAVKPVLMKKSTDELRSKERIEMLRNSSLLLDNISVNYYQNQIIRPYLRNAALEQISLVLKEVSSLIRHWSDKELAMIDEYGRVMDQLLRTMHSDDDSDQHIITKHLVYWDSADVYSHIMGHHHGSLPSLSQWISHNRDLCRLVYSSLINHRIIGLNIDLLLDEFSVRYVLPCFEKHPQSRYFYRLVRLSVRDLLLETPL